MSKNKNWSDIVEHNKNSVLQIISHHARNDVMRPYANPQDIKSLGSGFIIDIMRGLIVTNAHVVENSITILARSLLTGKEHLKLNLVGICRDRDLAICQLTAESKNLLINDMSYPQYLDMKFGDDMMLEQTEEVITIGYPLGKENIKVTTGVVSGFQHEANEDEDLGIQHPSYIQITAALNPGNSGGPLLNKEGKVVGINGAGYLFLQNIGYAIGARALVSIFEPLIENLSSPSVGEKGAESPNFKPKILKMPSFSIKWNRTNATLNKIKCGDSQFNGIYVSNVLKDSIFHGLLDEGDIIWRIIYSDPYWGGPESFSVTDLGIGDNKTSVLNKPKKLILCEFDNYGDISLYRTSEKNNGCYGYGELLLNRKIQLDELRNIIPINTQLFIIACKKDRKWVKITSEFEVSEIYRIGLKYLHFEKNPYYIFAGIVVTPLTLNHIQVLKGLNLSKYTEGETAFKPQLIIVQIFPNTQAYHVGTLKVGDIIESVNDIPVATMTDLNSAIESTGVYSTNGDCIAIKTKDKKYFTIDKPTFMPEDLEAISNFNIHDYKYHF